jgi:hypothetical protein
MLRRSTLLLAILVLTLLSFFSVQAKDAQPVKAGPEIVKVGIYLIRAGGLDISNGSIDVDFYLDFVCQNVCDKEQDKFELVNGSVRSSVKDDSNPSNPTYRVNATVFQEVDLKKYPFDSHEIQIIIESANQTDNMVYAVNPSTTTLDPQVFILGWQLDHNATADVTEKYYEAWNLSYSRYTFKAQLSKPILASWLKGILPAIFIMLGSLFALFITPKNIGSRVAIITSALVASVLYHLNFTSRVPSIGYLTFADTFMMINYVVLIISLGLTIWVLRADNADNKTPVEWINRIEVIAIPGLWLLLHILNVIWFF